MVLSAVQPMLMRVGKWPTLLQWLLVLSLLLVLLRQMLSMIDCLT
jgi:hypothetical protein